MPAIRGWFLNFDAAPVSENTLAGDGGPSQEEQQWKRMRSGDRPGLQIEHEGVVRNGINRLACVKTGLNRPFWSNLGLKWQSTGSKFLPEK
jgi:hypothetical protein